MIEKIVELSMGELTFRWIKNSSMDSEEYHGQYYDSILEIDMNIV